MTEPKKRRGNAHQEAEITIPPGLKTYEESKAYIDEQEKLQKEKKSGEQSKASGLKD